MKKAHSFEILIVLYLFLSVVITACGQVTPEPDQDIETTVPEPENVELRPAEFDGTITPGKYGDLDILIAVASLTNNDGQTLIITVAGSSAESVSNYLNDALFYFEIREPLDLPVVEEGTDDEPLSNIDLFQDETAEYLMINFDLAPETIEANPKGTLLVIVDPIVQQYQYNNYGMKNPSTDRVDVTMTVSTGKVEGKLYRECAAILGQTKQAWPGTPKTLTGTGAGDFDVTIKGINASQNKYKLTGAWNYDYGISVPSETNPRVTC